MATSAPIKFTLIRMAEEQRKTVRLKKALGMQYLSASQVWVTGLLRDISESGLSFTSDESFSKDSIITLRIKFPFNPFQWVELKGRCLEVKGLSIGIYINRLEFVDLEEEEQRVIREYITWALEKGLGI